MKRSVLYLLIIQLSILLLGCGNTASDIEESKYSKDVFAMDTAMQLTAYGERAKEAIEAAEAEINRLDKLLSTGNDESEISIANSHKRIKVSEDTALLIEKSFEINDSTDGAFDITVYPLMKAWGFTTKDYKVPDENELKKLLGYVDMSGIKYDIKTKNLSLPDNVEIDLGGIAKGYTSAKIMEIFEQYKVTSGIVSLGGNIQTYHSKPDGSKWKVGIKNPSSTDNYLGVVEVKDKAVITSGGYERCFEKDGKTYHHILNPITGYPAKNGLKSVTIVSEDGMLADGLSTALYVMGKEKAVAYWQKHREEFDMVLESEDNKVFITNGIEEDFTSDFEYEVIE